MQTQGFSIPSVPVYVPTVREILTAARTYYIATTGSDSTGVGSSGNPWRSPQYAYDYIVANLDLHGQTVIIQYADGTYTAAGDKTVLTSPWIGGGQVTFQGNTGNKDSVYLNVAGFKFDCFCVLPGYLNVQYFKFGGIGGISNWGVGWLMAQQLNFAMGGSDCFQVGAPGAIIDVIGDCTVSANAANFANSISPGSYVYLDAYTVGGWTLTHTGTPAYSSAFARAYTIGHVYVSGSGLTFTGGATGKYYAVAENSVIATEGLGATGLPGDTAGTNDGTGVYS